MPQFEHQPYTWFAARARNALRRRMTAGIVASIAFVAVLIGLVLIPRQATRAARAAAQIQIESRPDTAPVLKRRALALQQRARADSQLTRAREAAQRALVEPPPVIDTLSPELRAERDSLQALLNELNRAMERASSSPLPPAFRALAQTSALQGNIQVRRWLDSLDQIDKLREPFGALGAGDPIYVALTAQVNELGRSIRDAATLRRSELRARIAPLLPAPVPPAVIEAAIDTVPLLAARSTAQRELVLATQQLQQMREQNAAIDSALTRARELANLGAPPIAMLAAALVIALVIGFASAFGAELNNPRLANTREGEAVAGTRVLAVIRPVEIVERSRRQSDIDTPPLIDIVSESYRVLHLHLAATEASIPVITVTGDIPSIVATVASNLAAIAAYEARSTLLIDADPATNGVAAVLRIPAEPGLMGMLSGDTDWTESLVSKTIGRDRQLDVLPGGVGRLTQASGEAIDRVREDLLRMERQYDFIVIAAPTSYVQLTSYTIIPTQDVILCARLGETPLTDLRAMMRSLQGVGRRVHGLVLWDDDTPRIHHTIYTNGVNHNNRNHS